MAKWAGNTARPLFVPHRRLGYSVARSSSFKYTDFEFVRTICNPRMRKINCVRRISGGLARACATTQPSVARHKGNYIHSDTSITFFPIASRRTHPSHQLVPAPDALEIVNPLARPRSFRFLRLWFLLLRRPDQLCRREASEARDLGRLVRVWPVVRRGQQDRVRRWRQIHREPGRTGNFIDVHPSVSTSEALVLRRPRATCACSKTILVRSSGRFGPFFSSRPV